MQKRHPDGGGGGEEEDDVQAGRSDRGGALEKYGGVKVGGVVFAREASTVPLVQVMCVLPIGEVVFDEPTLVLFVRVQVTYSHIGPNTIQSLENSTQSGRARVCSSPARIIATIAWGMMHAGLLHTLWPCTAHRVSGSCALLQQLPAFTSYLKLSPSLTHPSVKPTAHACKQLHICC